jgi:CBS domain containing-hemolysin-like protein
VGGEGEAGLAQSARERIATMLKDTAGTGVLTESQAGLVDRALAFQRMTVGEVMTPWVRARTVPADWSREQLVRLLSRERIDVLAVVERGEARGGVVGVLRFEDAFVRTGSAAANLIRRPARLPARMSLPDAAAELREAEVDVGIVEVDGRPVGVVELSDVLEPLVG